MTMQEKLMEKEMVEKMGSKSYSREILNPELEKIFGKYETEVEHNGFNPFHIYIPYKGVVTIPYYLIEEMSSIEIIEKAKEKIEEIENNKIKMRYIWISNEVSIPYIHLTLTGVDEEYKYVQNKTYSYNKEENKLV